MTDWGAVSSWVAAGISVTAFGAGTGRAIWSRPQVDWALTGDMGWPGKLTDMTLVGNGKIFNFGDGNAHRVTVHVQRGSCKPGVLGTSPLLKPGDAIEFDLNVHADDYETSVVWVTWTSPPIRRNREKTSRRIPVRDPFSQSDVMQQRLDNHKKIVAFVQRDIELSADDA
jgi:hypothetical protein